MREARSPVDFLEMPNAKVRVWVCVSFLFVLVLVVGARCGKPHGQFRYVQSIDAEIKEPWGWWLGRPDLSLLAPPIYVFRPYYQNPEPIGPANLCEIKNAGVESDEDVMIAYLYLMGPGYSTTDFIVHRNRVATYKTIANAIPSELPRQSYCEPGRLSEKSLAEFHRVLDQTHLCEDPPRPTWENVGIDPLCVRRKNETCLIGIGDRQVPQQRLLKIALARLVISSCTSTLSVPPSTKGQW